METFLIELTRDCRRVVYVVVVTDSPFTTHLWACFRFFTIMTLAHFQFPRWPMHQSNGKSDWTDLFRLYLLRCRCEFIVTSVLFQLRDPMGMTTPMYQWLVVLLAGYVLQYLSQPASVAGLSCCTDAVRVLDFYTYTAFQRVRMKRINKPQGHCWWMYHK